MNKNKLGQEPAFPETHDNTDVNRFVIPGMSKRFYAACAAMQGLCSTELLGITVQRASVRCQEVVALAYKYADELIKQEYNEE